MTPKVGRSNKLKGKFLHRYPVYLAGGIKTPKVGRSNKLKGKFLLIFAYFDRIFG